MFKQRRGGSTSSHLTQAKWSAPRFQQGPFWSSKPWDDRHFINIDGKHIDDLDDVVAVLTEAPKWAPRHAKLMHQVLDLSTERAAIGVLRGLAKYRKLPEGVQKRLAREGILDSVVGEKKK